MDYFPEAPKVEGGSKQLRDLALKWDVDGSKQYKKASEYSPGFLSSGSGIVRGIFFPQHYKQGQTFSDDFLADSFSIGASCQRIISSVDSDLDRLHIRFEQRAEEDRSKRPNDKLPRKYMGFLFFRVGSARAIDYEKNSMTERVRVYDTAKPENNEHCDIFINNKDANGNEIRKIKNHVRGELFRLLTASTFYPSPFLDSSDDALLSLMSALAVVE